MALRSTSVCPVSPGVFSGIQNVDVQTLSCYNEKELRPIIPSLVRMSLCSPIDNTESWGKQRKIILKSLTGMKAVNNLVSLLSIDFRDLEQDVSKEKKLTESLTGNLRESLTINKSGRGLALEFEKSEAPQKLRLLISEMLFIYSQIREPRETFYERSSELFDSEIFQEEISDILCIIRAELPSLFSITEMAEALMHISNGAWLLCRLVANNPDSFLEVCTQLISSGPSLDEESLSSVRRSQALTMLCDMCPSYLLVVRSMCVEYCRLAGLALTLTLKYCERESTSGDSVGRTVVFVMGLLFDHEIGVRTWFAQFIRNGDQKKNPNSSVSILREKLLKELKESLQDLTAESKIIKGCAFIRLYSALRCIAGVKFTADENNTLLQLVTLQPQLKGSGTRFISLGLCFLLACPHLITSDQQEAEVIVWLNWLVKNRELYQQEEGDGSSFSEMLLLIAIHFHGSQNNAISDLVGTTLGMKAHVKASALAKMKNIFTLQVFTEQVVAALAVKVPVTANLNGKMKGFLPIHCIHSLLKSRTFSKHRVSIKDWICRQINECSMPVHPVMPHLIEVFTNSVLLPHAKIDRSNEPISEVDMCAIFDSLVDRNDDSSLATKLLYLLYILMYQDILINNMVTITNSRRKVLHYSQSFINQLPIRHLLHLAQSRSSDLAGMYSTLLNLVATHHHHLCLVNDWLDCGEIITQCEAQEVQDSLSEIPIACSPESLAEAIGILPKNPSLCAILMEKISVEPSENLLPYCNILIENLLVFLEDNVPRRCQDLVLTIWNKVNVVSPNLKLSTINALRPAATFNLYSLEEVTKDPLIVLRCDPRVFRCPPFVEMILSTLNCFLQMSKSFLSSFMTMGSAGSGNQSAAANEQEELRITLVAAQESAAIQILLESCLPSGEGDEFLLSSLREVQCLICTHIHQRFILDTSLAKLIHFQGYPMRLIPLAVAGISSMHICLDFLPELISQPQHTKLCFAIRLTSYLGLHYAIPKTMAVAKLCINVLTTLLPVLSSSRRVSFYYVVLPDLVRFCTAFPALCDDTVAFLFQLARVMRAEAAGEVVHTEEEEEEEEMAEDSDVDFEFSEDDEAVMLSTPMKLLRRIYKTVTMITSSTSLLKVKMVV